MEDHNDVIPRRFLCCKLCDDEYRQPKYLPCLHSFCKTCLMDYVQKNTSRVGYFCCPICGTEINARQKGPEDFPDNNFARRLSCPVAPTLVREKMCHNCQNSGKIKESVSHCVNCDEFLCESCSQSHLGQEETASHKIQPVQEYDSNNSVTRLTDSIETCTSNVLSKCCDMYDPLDIGAMFCVDCDLAVCADCHTSKHVDHRCAELTAIAENFVTKIKEPITELANDARILTKNLKELDKSDKIICRNQIELKKQVKDRTKVLCKLIIEEYETVLLSEIDKRHQESKKQIKEKTSEIQMHLASLTAVTELTEKLVTFGSDEEKVSMRRKIGRRVRELCENPLPEEACYEPICLQLTEQRVSVEKICDIFGELIDREITPRLKTRLSSSLTTSFDSHLASSSDFADENLTEITELDEDSDLENDNDMLSASNQSDVFYAMAALQPQPQPTEIASENADNSFHSSFHEDVACQNLDRPSNEIFLPSNIQKECIKGIGVNIVGDIIIGAVSPGNHTIHVMEKRGIIRGQSSVESGWNLHSVASDGKVSLMATKGDNRYKIKVLTNDGSGTPLSDVQLETFGLNYFTANSLGHVIVTSNRYGQLSRSHGKAAKSGGNIAIYNTDGAMIRRITNDDFQDIDLYLLEKPCGICVDSENNFFVADPGSHIVCGFTADGKLIFEYGNTDTDEEFYQGPDSVCTDNFGNIIVTDKREGRIDVLNHEGQLQKCLFSTDNMKFVSTTPDKLLMVATSEGTIKFYEYL